ncbi:DNA-processing protein DprA [Cellulomonas bogoriensis]|uniref:DNA processing protein DprA n=1 Tax=Cellulomonas bogoriensis 69B4 = DSM 16987 TaxID=1386082 RepID=A0A0A0C452_9CELL|nr:DNA-processing protein DprA [Cellulomonas bogoriensis]KGM14149.1 DNA processing protein DprA [Cellulomonas bogoriensis 69B4 = DSM 16987]
MTADAPDRRPVRAGSSWTDTEVALAAWSSLCEPGDRVAGALVHALGAVQALDWVRSAVLGGVLPSLPVGPDDHARLARAVARWAGRLAGLEPERDLDRLARLGGRFLSPAGPGWPAGLSDLGVAAPFGLWARGELVQGRTGELAGALTRSVAVVGARASTGYGEHVTAELASGLADRGWTVVSGGAYGIDAVAHRGALAGDGPTVAVLAGGVDRLYPAGNTRLLQATAATGAVVSEVPPGAVPTRSRFLKRNRMIAALTRGTVVVEAAWRSGALSTATHATELLRPVGAVPGPVTSAASAGCHRLLRDGAAVCVTDVREVVELVGAAGQVDGCGREEQDGLTRLQEQVLDVTPVNRGSSVETVARAACLTERETWAALGALELRGRVRRAGSGWQKIRS